MILKPMVRNNIFLNAHPVGCARETKLQIARADALGVKLAASAPAPRLPRHVLVVGCSTGYGLASRIVAACAYGASTVGFSLEREPTAAKPGSPGWYANRAFDAEAASRGIFAKTFNVDAFSREATGLAVSAARDGGFSYDLVIYSLASPVRVDPDTGVMYRSTIKPIGREYAGKTVDVFSGAISEARIQPADEKEIDETVKVMGGEDWSRWIDELGAAGVLADGATTVAYSYVGPQLSWPIYRDGTIGRAKTHLEASAREIAKRHAARKVHSYVSINKAVVTRASAVIPVIPLYVSTLFKVMKKHHIHEDCLDQMVRLFDERLYRRDGGSAPLDAEGRIRLDELEMGTSVQQEVAKRLAAASAENLAIVADLDGYREDFLRAHGFAVPGVDYDAEVDLLA
jgi:enoyl-[acyl-carrier protein] reductase/trans-2-enoyl-CoA reductase (NAD+)